MCFSPFAVLGKVCFLSLLGFLAVTLSGPFFAVLSILVTLFLVGLFFIVPFALVGLLVWLPCRLLMPGRTHWRREGHLWMQVASERAQRIGGLLREIFSGAAVGGLLGAWFCFQHGRMDQAIALGLAIGALVGASVAIWNDRSRQAEVLSN